jgi:hypothetical protein
MDIETLLFQIQTVIPHGFFETFILHSEE